MTGFRYLVVFAGAFVTGIAAYAGDDDPLLAPGRDPAGTAVAVLADGFDTTRADVAKVLARDGEGDAIAWDAVEGDHRPFSRDGAGTAVALAAAARGGVRIVAVRVDAANAASLAQGVAFATGTPARIVLVPLDASSRAGLKVMMAAAKRFDTALFVVSVPGLTAEEKRSGEDLVNLILLEQADNVPAAAEAVARVIGCGRGELTGSTGGELKRAFLGRLEGKSPAGCKPENGAKAN